MSNSTDLGKTMGQGHNHDEHASHDHAEEDGAHEGHAHGSGASGRQLLTALGLTCSFMFAEVVGGIISHSLALLTDAAHMLTDAASLAMAYAAARAASRPATERLTYGHHRWQVLAAFVNGLGLLALSVWIVVEAIQRLREPPAVMGGIVVVLGFVGLLVNLLAFKVLSSGEKNLNVRGALAHVAGDLLGSVAALLAGGIIILTGWTLADPLLSAVVAVLMLRTGWKISRESAHILLEGAPASFNLKHITETVIAVVPEVTAIHHVHAWTLTEGKVVMTLHAVISPSADGDKTIVRITDALRNAGNVGHVTVQIEREACTPDVRAVE